MNKYVCVCVCADYDLGDVQIYICIHVCVCVCADYDLGYVQIHIYVYMCVHVCADHDLGDVQIYICIHVCVCVCADYDLGYVQIHIYVYMCVHVCADHDLGDVDGFRHRPEPWPRWSTPDVLWDQTAGLAWRCASHCTGGCLPTGLLALLFTHARQSANWPVCTRAELLKGQSRSTHLATPKWHKLSEQLRVCVGLRGSERQRGDEAKCGSAGYYDGEFWWARAHFALIIIIHCRPTLRLVPPVSHQTGIAGV